MSNAARTKKTASDCTRAVEPGWLKRCVVVFACRLEASKLPQPQRKLHRWVSRDASRVRICPFQLPEQPYKVRLLRTSNADKTMRLTSSRNLLAGSCLPKPELPLPLPLRAPKRHDPVLPVPAKVLVMEAFPMPYKIRSRGGDFGYGEGSGGGPSTCPATRGIPLPRVSPRFHKSARSATDHLSGPVRLHQRPRSRRSRRRPH